MDTDLKNTSEDAEMVDSDGEKVVTMMDVLQEQEDFEEDANAVLGASDDKNCTYSKGYIKRQAIYACMTCCSEAKDDLTKRAGVCLACSLTCHENHDLIELYTKRNFKCDCGNPKFNSHPCQFTPDKTDLNEDNDYNQNFSGVYCVCARPHPDPESTAATEMIQCTICEDWLHATHLDATVPDNDQYSEMICKGCMEKYYFLHDYSNLAVNVDVVTNGNDDNILCNGDAKDETEKATADVDMIVKVGTSAPEEYNDNIYGENNIAETNDDNKKNGENVSDTNESAYDKKEDETSANTDMETEESKPVVTSENVENEEKETPDVSNDNLVEETIKDICMIAGNKDVENQNENSVNQEQNEKKEPATEDHPTESAEEAEKIERIDKSAEQLEEEILLADPDDGSKMSKGDNKVQTLESTPAEADINTETALETKKQNEPSNIEDSISEKPDDSTKEGTYDSTDAKGTTEVKIKENGALDINETVANNENHNGEKRKLCTDENSGTDKKKAKLIETNESCVRPRGVQKVYKGATFWPSTLRQKLCTCKECITMYKDLSVLFLIDPEDTVTAYESLGKLGGKPATQYEKGMQALSSLDRIQQINALTEYNKMRDKLLDYLRSFKDRKEVVKEEDIKAFFAGMKPKREPDGVYFCR